MIAAARWTLWLFAVGVATCGSSCATLPKLPQTEVVLCSAAERALPPELTKALDERHIDAITIGPVTFYRRNADDPCLREHERCHRDQYEALGARFFEEYLRETADNGYTNNRFENDCRAVQTACERASARSSAGGRARMRRNRVPARPSARRQRMTCRCQRTEAGHRGSSWRGRGSLSSP